MQLEKPSEEILQLPQLCSYQEDDNEVFEIFLGQFRFSV